MHKYSVVSNQRLTSNTLLLTLRRDERESKPFTFQPGQYAAISFKKHGRPTAARCFSIVSSPTHANILQFSMRTNGRYTKALTGLITGDEVNVRGPFGGFVFEPSRDSQIVLLAGGIGITPFMSMIRYATANGLGNKITLLLSSKHQNDIPFYHSIKQLEASNPNFKAIFVIGDGVRDKLVADAVASGRITTGLIDHAIAGNYAGKTFFICGPQTFMKAMNKILHEKGVPDHSIMTEAFSQGPNRQTGKIRSWPFNIYVMSALGVALGSFTVMVSDLLKTLPPSSILNSSNNSQLSALSNSRQADLDQLVNGLPEATSTSPASDAATSALQQSSTSATTQSVTTQSTPAPTVTQAPAPTPKPTPKCTTTQSGIKTCV